MVADTIYDEFEADLRSYKSVLTVVELAMDFVRLNPADLAGPGGEFWSFVEGAQDSATVDQDCVSGNASITWSNASAVRLTIRGICSE